MLFWFVGTAFVTVWFVFRDDRFDYRVLAIGAVAPDVVDSVTGGSWVMHSVTASIAMLVVVMAVARRGSLRRRRWLALPIGSLLHLVFDGAFDNTRNFWWPFAGLSFDGRGIPSLGRMPVNVVLEAAGLLMLWWLWRTNELSDPGRRRRFLKTGHLLGASTGPGGTTNGAGTC